MGCCVSKQQDLYIDIPRVVSTTDTWALRQKSFLNGCKLLPFTAGCPASYPYQTLTRVVLGDGHLFAALWEGQGGSQAARHCTASCYETLLQCLQSNPDPCWALKQTVQLLDKSYLASEDVPDMVKASVGATGTMLYINTRTNQCCIARLGDSMPFFTESKGAFNTTHVDVKHLTSTKTHKLVLGEQQQQQMHSSKAAAYIAPDEGQGFITYTHAVGLGYGKSAKLQQAWLKQQHNGAALKQQLPQLPFITSSCEVREMAMSQLSNTNETLVLASEGLLQVLPPQELALLLHHFDAAKLTELKKALTAAAVQHEAVTAQAKGKVKSRAKARGSREMKPDEAVTAAAKAARHPNVANIVMHHALMKSLDKHNVLMSRKEQLLKQHTAGDVPVQSLPKLSYDELTQLPLDVDTEAFRPPGAKGTNAHIHLPKQYPAGGLCKKDVHGDMGLVVISLNWPRAQDNQPLPGLSPQRAGRGAIKPAAQYRWQLLRLAVKFHMAYRRTLRSRWWELVDAVEIAAAEAARKAEVHAWKSTGAAVKVNLAGDVLAPEAPMRVRHSPHKTPVQQSPKKTPSSLRASTSGGGSSRIPVVAAVAAAAGSTAGRMATPPRAAAVPAALPGTPASTATPLATPASAAASGVRDSISSMSRASRQIALAQLDIGFEQEVGDQQSDVESPTRLDSPSKAAKSAAAAMQSTKKSTGMSSSPTKPYRKDNLSLRSSRVPASVGAAASPLTDTAIMPEASWGTASRSSTPGQLRMSTPAAVGSRNTPSAARGGGSPVKALGYSTPTSQGSSKVDDYSGYHAAGYGAATGRGSSPTKGSRSAGRLSLRKQASHY